ncbi:TPA: tyrosine-type recombinase/integrase [Pseudomonas aeruginosa]
MRLLFTDESFLVAGIPKPGIPFLAYSDAVLVDPANRYLYFISCIKGRTSAPTTWRTYADHLYDFFCFLEENDLSWRQVGRSHLAGWRDGMRSRGLKRSTCNSRIRTVAAFFTWSKRTGLIDEVPFDYESVSVSKPRGFLAHVDASGNKVQANELTLPSATPLPKFLSLRQAVAFIEALSPERTQLVAWLMLLCGLRREETARLDIRVLPSPAGHDPAKMIKMTLDPSLTPTKGSRERWVNLPYPLAGKLHDYLMLERPTFAKRFKQKYGHHTTKLFLTQFGEELSLDGLDDQFQKTSKVSGIKCNPHMLRHTFAVHELARMSGKPSTNALLWVRDRLGHSSISTTQIYLKAADLVDHTEMDGYVAEMLKAMGGKASE